MLPYAPDPEDNRLSRQYNSWETHPTYFQNPDGSREIGVHSGIGTPGRTDSTANVYRCCCAIPIGSLIDQPGVTGVGEPPLSWADRK